MAAPRPDNEILRLKALHRSGILDTAPDQEFDDIVRLAALVCGAPIAGISFIDAERQWCKSTFGIDVKETSREAAFCAYTILNPTLTVVADALSDARFADNPSVKKHGIRFYAGAPLLSDDGFALGALCVADRVPRTLTPEQEDALIILARQVANHLRAARRLVECEQLLNEKERLMREKKRIGAVLDVQRRELDSVNAKLATLVTTDCLTGLCDRRAFQERLIEEVYLSGHYGTPLSLLLLDIDDFKGFNDAYGHPAGDAALIAVARLLNGCARSHDLVARYGGEEFVLLLPRTDQSGAAAYAERVRAAIEGDTWPLRSITASFGVANLGDGESIPDLIARADRALYQAKAAGRNSVVCASPPATVTAAR